MKYNITGIILPVFLATDLLLPFLLAPAYKGYNHLTQVMSVLGNQKAPLHSFYNAWLIALGILLLIASFRLYSAVAQVSPLLSALLCLVTIAYALGGCLLSGIFPVGETKSLDTISAQIHGYGSVIGFLLLTFAPLFIGWYFFKISNRFAGTASVLCFVLAILFFVLFVMADKPVFRGTVIAFEGLWQRLSLLFMYIPLGIISFFIASKGR